MPYIRHYLGRHHFLVDKSGGLHSALLIPTMQRDGSVQPMHIWGTGTVWEEVDGEQVHGVSAGSIGRLIGPPSVAPIFL